MKKLILLCLLPLALSAFELSTPEAEGVSSDGILAWIAANEEQMDAVHSFVLLRHGKLVAEGYWKPFRSELPHAVYSISKSFTGTAAGLAVEENKLSFDARVATFFPEALPANPPANLLRMRVRDLLTMTCGQKDDTIFPIQKNVDANWEKSFFAQPVPHEPGFFFKYNSGASYMLASIVQKATGEDLLAYLQTRVLKKLGFANESWSRNPQGVCLGGYGFAATTRDLVKFGQLYLQGGVWNGERLLPDWWVKQATTRQTRNGKNLNDDWQCGYGFQFWLCRHNTYCAIGAGGQRICVMPKQDAVLAITAGLPNSSAMQNLVWQHLLPALKSSPLPQNDEAQKRLSAKIASLALKPVPGKMEGEAKCGAFALEKNSLGWTEVSLEKEGDAMRISFNAPWGRQNFPVAFGGFAEGKAVFSADKCEILFNTPGEQTTGASGAWTSPDTYSAKVYLTSTQHKRNMTFVIRGDSLDFYFDRTKITGKRI